MDPESASFTPRDDLWRFQSEMLRVQQGQVELAHRVARLEQRQEEDTRLKNVWGTSSSFPTGLTGATHQVSLQPSSSDHFSNFDDQPNSLIGNLHLDADDEPRRIGATSRANSVRFDESANQAHWAHSSRSSLDLIPRTGSGLGGHFMSERSYSHKSDGRQSSAGHSVHSAASGRANSLTSFGAMTPLEVPGVAPGLLILGSAPAIIRCWLNTNFKHDTLLYAAICSGSYGSYVDSRLVNQLGYEDLIGYGDDGQPKIKLPFYLPEAIPLTSSLRASSPAPQVPSLSIEFTVVGPPVGEVADKAIQIFLGSDTLRAHNADVLFSSNQLILYDNDHSKLQIPLVRPEDDRTFKSLFVTSGSPNVSYRGSSAQQGKTVTSKGVTFAENPEMEGLGPDEESTQMSRQQAANGRQQPEGSVWSEIDAGEVGLTKTEDTGSRQSSISSKLDGPWRKTPASSTDIGKSNTPPLSERPGIAIFRKPRASSAASAASSSQPEAQLPSLAKIQSLVSDHRRETSTSTSGSGRNGSSQKTTIPSSNKAVVHEELPKDSTGPQNKTRSIPGAGGMAFPWMNTSSGRLK